LFWRPVDERQALGGASKAARLRTAPFARTVPNMGTSTNQKLLAYFFIHTRPVFGRRACSRDGVDYDLFNPVIIESGCS
jgi:hypothetical protein